MLGFLSRRDWLLILEAESYCRSSLTPKSNAMRDRRGVSMPIIAWSRMHERSVYLNQRCCSAPLYVGNCASFLISWGRWSMFRYSVTITSLALGLFSLIPLQTPGWVTETWAADEQAKPGQQTQPSHGTETTMPDGVIGVSLHVGAERVGDMAVLYVAHVLPEGPAQQAGLKQGDELTSVDGVAVAGKTYE